MQLHSLHALFVRSISGMSVLALTLAFLHLRAAAQVPYGIKIARHHGFTIHASEVQHDADSTVLQVVVVDSNGHPVRALDCDPAIGCSDENAAFWGAIRHWLIGTNVHVPRLRVQEHAAMSLGPHAIGFVLDHSPSMTTPRAIRMQRSVHSALEQLLPGDAVTVVKFTAAVNVEVPITTNHDEARRRFTVSGLNPKYDGTAIHDAVMRGIDEVSRYPGTRVLFVFTDGEDNSSKTSLDSVIRHAKRMRTTINIITYGMDDVSTLKPLAAMTGGCVHELSDVYDIDHLFAARYAALRWYYTVTAWRPSSHINEHAGAVLTMEGAHALDQPLHDVVDKLSGATIELVNGVTDEASVVLRLPRIKADSAADRMGFEGLDHLAGLLRSEADLAVEVLQDAGHTAQSHSKASTFEMVRRTLQSEGVDAQQILRGATVEDRFGSVLQGDGTSLYLVLYRP